MKKKRIFSGCFAILLLLTTLLMLCACSGPYEEYEICETRIYTEKPPITELIMNMTTSIEEDAELKSISNKDPLEASGTSYLVFLCYGTPDASDLADRLRFVLVSGEELMYDEDCVTISETKDYDIPNNPFHAIGRKNVEGVMMVAFDLHTGKEGQLYVDYDDGHRKTLLESPVGEIDKGAEVVVDNMKVGYLTEASYNNGDFADEMITALPELETGVPSYMVLDVAFTARQKNEGDLALSMHIGFPGLREGGITIESAPTTDIKMVERNGILDVCATYSVPQERNGVKNVRMILRMNQPEEIGKGIHMLLAGNQAVTMLGMTYMPDLTAEGISFEAFVPAWKRDTLPTWGKVLIAIGVLLVLIIVTFAIVGFSSMSEWWEWYMPFISWLATAVLMILLFCLTSFAWWVVLIETLVVYIALTLSHVLAANIADSNTGSCGPMAFTLLISAVGSILLLLLAPMTWWIPMLLAVGGTAVLALIGGAIGYHM